MSRGQPAGAKQLGREAVQRAEVRVLTEIGVRALADRRDDLVANSGCPACGSCAAQSISQRQ
jgi:hypothetical protein